MAVYNQVKWMGIKPTVLAAQEPGKQVAIDVASTRILAANNDRTSFSLIVRGSVNVFVMLGPIVNLTGVELEPGDALSCDDYTGDVHGIVAAGSGRVDVFEV